VQLAALLHTSGHKGSTGRGGNGVSSLDQTPRAQLGKKLEASRVTRSREHDWAGGAGKH